MKIYCTKDFQKVFKKLVKSNSYLDLESGLIELLFGSKANMDSLDAESTLLNGDPSFPFVKIRIGGRSGYRLYCYLVRKADSVYLAFVHPKKGASGIDNIGDTFKEDLILETAESIWDNNLLEMAISGKKLTFTEIN